ncbi:hypothetical protein MFIFM68171_09524 [Madurella fahalii]|uniref:Uncharacterized protein n=1 Tax=Madurella fahalii TaxID=1157608 RepID=A0ABQ0GNJ2_9PEZI
MPSSRTLPYLLHFLLAFTSAAVTSQSASNPCENPHFHPPVYVISDFRYRKQQQHGSLQGAANFTITDIANNYSIACGNAELTGGINYYTPDDTRWFECDANHTLSSPDKGEVKMGYEFGYGSNKVYVTQEWACPKPDGLYPWTYIGLAQWSFTSPLNCPNDTTAPSGPVVNCTWSKEENVDPTRTASWVPATPDATVVPITPNSASVVVTEETLNSSCIRRSFTYPGWLVEAISSNSLELRNMATNYSVTCHLATDLDENVECKGGEWARNGLAQAPDTQLRWSSTGELSISQAWTCARTKSGFKSKGSIMIPPECTPEKGACLGRSFEVQGMLTEPIALRPNRPPPPPGIKTPGCTAASATPRWTLSNIRQRQEKLMVVSAFVGILRRTGILDFDLHNHANNLTTHCHIEGEELTNYTGYPLQQDTIRYDKWWSCDVNASDPHQFPKYNVSTMVQFDKRIGFLGLNHTWYCSDEGDDHPASFTAHTSTILPLQCNDTTPRSSDGSLLPYTLQNEECFVSSPQTLHPNNITRHTLPPGELLNADPVHPSCTVSSVLSATWELRNWSARTDWDLILWLPDVGGYETRVSFSLWNSGFGKPLAGYVGDRELTPYALFGSDTEKWYPCTAVPDGPNYEQVLYPVGHLWCFWRVDLATGYFAVNQSWVCDDKDSEHPIIFEAVGARYLELDCKAEPGWLVDLIYCRYADPKPITPTSISWRTSSLRIG